MAAGMTQAELHGFGRHGGRIDDAMRAFPRAPHPWLDLSTGINPVAWGPPAGLKFDSGPLPAITALRVLEAAAADYFGVAASRVAAVPGSEVALRLLPMLGLPGPIVAAHPGYGTHGEVAAASVATIAARPGTMLFANPNNPDGRLFDRATMQGLAARQAETGGWLAIDEAFVDTLPEASILPGLDDAAPVVVLRSFGKFFGLAGLRLGFIVAPPAVIERVRRLFGDWPVSAQAIAWGRAAYADAGWIDATRRALDAGAARLDALLARHALVVRGASPLFRLVEQVDAPALFERLARAGILTRPFADRPDWLRFGLPGDDAAFDRLDRALAGG